LIGDNYLSPSATIRIPRMVLLCTLLPIAGI
jgi:hypothetical protein